MNDHWNEPSAGMSELAYHAASNQQATALPTFCKTIAIIDLVMGSLRLLIVPVSVLGYFMIEDGDPLKGWAIPEIMIGLLIGIVAIAANIAMLKKVEWAVPAGYVNIGATALGVLFGILQAPVTYDSQKAAMPDPSMESAMMIGVVVGVIISVAVRGTLAVLVFLAIKRYKAFLAGR